jgi:hypothetical protein
MGFKVTPEELKMLRDMLTVYEKRVEKNARTFKVEVHVPLQDMRIILQLARAAVSRMKVE